MRKTVFVLGMACAVLLVGMSSALAQTVVCDPYGQRCTEVLGESETKPPPPAVPETEVLGVVEVRPVSAPAPVEVAPVEIAPVSQALPVTGADIAGMIVLAMFLLGTGALLLTAGRREPSPTSGP